MGEGYLNRLQQVSNAAAAFRQHKVQAITLGTCRAPTAWLAHVPQDGVNLSKGERYLVPEGRLESNLPNDLVSGFG